MLTYMLFGTVVLLPWWKSRRLGVLFLIFLDIFTEEHEMYVTILLTRCISLLSGSPGSLFSTKKYARQENTILAAPKPKMI